MPLQFTAKPSRGHMPVKRTINLATVGEKNVNLAAAIPAIILVAVLASLFSKYAITDRFREVAEMQREVSRIQRQIDEVNATIDSMGTLAERYAHYTYTGLTREELTATDRIQIMDLVERLIMPSLVGSSWSVSGNQMVLNLKGSSLEDINQLIQRFLEEPLVDYCTISTARQTPQDRAADAGEPVVASVTIVFKDGDVRNRTTQGLWTEEVPLPEEQYNLADGTESSESSAAASVNEAVENAGGETLASVRNHRDAVSAVGLDDT